MRIIDLLNVASEHLRKNGFENSRLEVERLLGSVIGLSRIDLYMEFERPLTDEELEQFRSLYKRRLAHEPLQYIIGSTDFREIEVKTDSRALIPRPETEVMVQIAIDFLKHRPDPLVADLGTGSGVIAISIVYEVPGSHAVAVDISDEALMLTEQNALMTGVEGSITLVSGDMLNGLRDRGPFDVILSNPPYVKSHDIGSLQSEVRDYEPMIAFDGGPDGLRYLNTIAEGAHQFLKSGGLLLLECDGAEAEQVRKTLEMTSCYTEVKIIQDIAGKSRVVKALAGQSENQ